MKFGREFYGQMIQEWGEAYIDYHSLKSIIKLILAFRRQNVAFQATGTGTATATAKGTATTQGLDRRISFYRAFSGLTNRVRNAPGKHGFANNEPYFKSNHFYEEEEEEVILVSQDESAHYTTTFLSSSEEGGDLEVSFFRTLDGELNKVLKFYKTKVEELLEEADELSRQLNALIALRVKVENPLADLMDSPSFHSLVQSTDRKQAASPMAVIREMENEGEVPSNGDKKRFQPAPVEVLDRVKIKIETETPLSTLKCMIINLASGTTFTKRELKKAEELISRALVEFYHKLRLLKSYCLLNQMAFSKILKKYDKTTSRNASKAYLQTVDNSYLGSCDEISRLMTRVEATYIKHFANGNHSEGMRALRPKAKRQRHRTTYFLGFLSGCAIALAVAIIVLIHVRGITDSKGRHQYMENIFPLYSLFGLVSLHLLMYAADIYFWIRARVNYAFIFGFEKGTELGYREVLLVGSILAVLSFIGVISNLDMEMDPRTKSFSVITELVPLALLCVLLLILICPFNVIYRSSRYFFIGCVFRCVLSPLYKVILSDFFLADQFTSQVQAFRSLLFYVCYYGWGDFKRRTNKCNESDVYKSFYIIVAFIPYWFRFAQCIRRLIEEKDKHQGYNALKYLSTIVAVAARTIFESRKGDNWLVIAAVTSGLATIINLYWDIFMDWGLMVRNSKNPWLRDKLLVEYKSVYFVAMVVNTFLRLAWMQTVLGIKEAPFLHKKALIFVVGSLEIIRRGIWNFFRLENEHVNNVGKYRAFKSVPLPFHYQDSGGSKSM